MLAVRDGNAAIKFSQPAFEAVAAGGDEHNLVNEGVFTTAGPGPMKRSCKGLWSIPSVIWG